MAMTLIFNSFLESGKTSFIRNASRQPYFQMEGTTLLLACEEGEVEYSEKELSWSNTVVKYITNEADFNASNLMKLDIEYEPTRVIIEWNGTWDVKKMMLPFHWEVKQQVTMIDAETFEMYYGNMRSMMMEMIKKSSLVIFNRCDNVRDKLGEFKRNIMLVNQKAQIGFEGRKERFKVTVDEELPYDINSDVIELSDAGYVSWYMHCMESAHKYEGKKLKFVAQIIKNESIQKGYMVPGRQVMTCCEDDVTFVGYPCKYNKAKDYESGDWVELMVRFTLQNCFAYKGKGPVLEVEEIRRISQPMKPVIGSR